MPRKFKRAKIRRPNLKDEIATIKRMASKKKPPQRVIVHLGNVDDRSGPFGYDSEKTATLAKRFPKFKFIGTDTLRSHRPRLARTENWEQRRAEFKDGLKELPDNSADLISSEMALGYYGSKPVVVEIIKTGDYKKNTIETVELARKKLKPGGKLRIVVNVGVLESIKGAIKEAGFKEDKIEIMELTKRQLTTDWLKRHYKGERKFFQVVAQK